MISRGGFYLPYTTDKKNLIVLALKYRLYLTQVCFLSDAFFLVLLFIAFFSHKVAIISFSFIILNSFVVGALGIKLWSTKKNYIITINNNLLDYGDDAEIQTDTIINNKLEVLLNLYWFIAIFISIFGVSQGF